MNDALDFKKQCFNTETKIQIKIEKEQEELKYEIEFLEEEHVEEPITSSDFEEDIAENVFETKNRKIKKEFKKPEIPQLIRCTKCKQLFNSLQESLLHQKNKCEDVYPCEECPKIFASKDICERHVKFAHPVENPNECKLCFKIFKSIASLKCHNKYVHLKVRTNFCDICGKGFIDITGLRVHKESHKPKGEARLHKQTRRNTSSNKNEIPRICELCGLQFPNYHSHYGHLRTKHSEHFIKTLPTGLAPTILHKCTLCKVTCKSNAQLERHSRVHTDVRPFECTQCSSAFKLRNHLKSHIKTIHLGEKKYKCGVCGKELNDKGNFDVHLRKHEGIKPFACHYCSDTFYGPRLLKKHTLNIIQPC